MWFLLGAVLVWLVLEAFRSSRMPRVNTVEIFLNTLPPALDGLRVLHISDMHNRSFGRQNESLAHFICHQHPDLILATGDMIETRKNGDEAFYQLLKKLNGQYPVYFSLGNHELYLEEEKTPMEIVSRCIAMGATLLDNRSVIARYMNTPYMLSGYCASVQKKGALRALKHASLEPARKEGLEEALGAKPESLFTLLLAHDPDSFPAYTAWGADLTLSGHIHGGLWRPFHVGILSPARRFFPQYDAGLYRDETSGGALFVSTGLAGAILPRLWNPPEIAVLTLRREPAGKEVHSND